MVARNKMVLSGTLGTPGIEQWSVGLNWVLDGGETVTAPTDLQTWCNTVATYMDGADLVLGDIAGMMGTSARCERVDIYAYPASGPATASATATFGFSGSGTITNAPQIACGVSLLTDRSGRSYRGRFYWPALGASVNSSLNFAEAADVDSEFAEMLGNLSNIDGVSSAQLVIYSETQNVVTPVTTVRVGNVLDTQRRRRDGLTETYFSVPYIP